MDTDSDFCPDPDSIDRYGSEALQISTCSSSVSLSRVMQSTSSDAARLLAALAGWVGVPWEELAPSESESSMGTGASTYTGKFDRIAVNQLVKMLVTGLQLRLWLKLLLSILQLAP